MLRPSICGCDICGIYLRSQGNYDYFKGICPVCRKKVPSYVPEEQIVKWLKYQVIK